MINPFVHIRKAGTDQLFCVPEGAVSAAVPIPITCIACLKAYIENLQKVEQEKK